MHILCILLNIRARVESVCSYLCILSSYIRCAEQVCEGSAHSRDVGARALGSDRAGVCVCVLCVSVCVCVCVCLYV